jgi:SAM-dependent methyltransferase
MGCDSPPRTATDMAFELPIRVVGWAYSRTRIEQVIVFVDGRPVQTSYGHSRPDVAAALSERDAARSGFTALLGVGDCPPGRHELSVVAVDRNQRAVGMRMTVIAESSSQDEGRADQPRLSTPSADLSNDGERYVPEVHRGTYTEAEHESRYNWAAPLARGRTVLDAGCGVGWGTARLASAGAHRVIGVDVDEGSLASGRERAAGAAEFVRGDLLELPFDDDLFELVVCFEAIEHVSDPARVLDELRRVLRDDGLLAISSPNRGVYPAGNAHHLHELSSQELEDELRSRFSDVAMYRQQTYLGSLVVDDPGYASDDPGRTIPARVHKAHGGRAGDELYTIALAGNAGLPEVENVAVLGAPLDIEAIAMLEHRALLAEAKQAAAAAQVRQIEEREVEARAEAQRATDEAHAARAEAESARRWLEELQQSASWRLTSPLRATKRAAERATHRDDG